MCRPGKAGWLPNTAGSRRDKWTAAFLCDKRAPQKCRSTASRLISLDVRLLSGNHSRRYDPAVSRSGINLEPSVRFLSDLCLINEKSDFYISLPSVVSREDQTKSKLSVSLLCRTVDFHTAFVQRKPTGFLKSKLLTTNSKSLYFFSNRLA